MCFVWFNCPMLLNDVRTQKQSVACRVKRPVLVNLGILVRWPDLGDLTLAVLILV